MPPAAVALRIPVLKPAGVDGTQLARFSTATQYFDEQLYAGLDYVLSTSAAADAAGRELGAGVARLALA